LERDSGLEDLPAKSVPNNGFSTQEKHGGELFRNKNGSKNHSPKKRLARKNTFLGKELLAGIYILPPKRERLEIVPGDLTSII